MTYCKSPTRVVPTCRPVTTEEEEAMTREGTTDLVPMTEQCRVYKRRWLMLALFAMCSMTNAAHWLQFSIIANIIRRYYDVSNLAINWTSMIYMTCYVVMCLPASWLLDKKGLRVTVIAGSLIMTTGSWIKVASAATDRFYVAFIGQALTGAAQMFVLGIPSRLAAVWFGPKQVSTACAIGVFGNQVGIALGFLLPPALVANHADLDAIGSDLQTLYYGMAIAPTIVLVLLIIFFEKAPPVPPSPAQVLQQDNKNTYVKTLKKLLTNPNFCLLLISYGINCGVFYVVSTLLNQIVLGHFEDAEADAGRIGLIMVLAGIVGSITGGVILDKTHRFKETVLVVYSMALAGMLMFTFTMDLGYISLVYTSGAFLGFFMTGYLGIGFEYGTELTYPIPEGTSSGLLNMSSELFGIIFTLSGGEVFDTYGDRVTNISLSVVLLGGFIMSMFIRGKLKRHTISKESQPKRVIKDESQTA